MNETRSLRLLLVDNSTFRAGLRQEIALHDNATIVGEADTARDAVLLAPQTRPDVVVTDLTLPDGSGIELCRYLCGEVPGIHILVLSSFDWDVFLASSWEAGAAGMLLRSAPTADLVRDIISASSDLIYTPSQLSRVRAWRRTVGDPLQTLSTRERYILRLVASGRSNRELAHELNLSENTVEKHLTSMLQKFRVSSRTALLALILRYHLDHLPGIGQMADFRHPRMADFRHPEMAEIRDDTATSDL